MGAAGPLLFSTELRDNGRILEWPGAPGHGRVSEPMTETTDASAILAPFWRFKWLILVVGLLAAGLTYLHYSGRKPTYAVATVVNTANGYEEQGITPPEPKRRGKKNQNVSPAAGSAAIIASPVIHRIVAA